MIIALAGRRIDAADETEPRFPLANRAAVQARIRDRFVTLNVSALVSSAACGADLLAQAVARELGGRTVVVLPIASTAFRIRSVTDRPGAWGALFDTVIADAQQRGDLYVLNSSDKEVASGAAYAQTNDAILDRALALGASATEMVRAITVWDGRQRRNDDMTAQFRESAIGRGIEVEDLATR